MSLPVLEYLNSLLGVQHIDPIRPQFQDQEYLCLGCLRSEMPMGEGRLTTRTSRTCFGVAIDESEKRATFGNQAQSLQIQAEVRSLGQIEGVSMRFSHWFALA